MRGLLKGSRLPPGEPGAKALLEKIVVIMREAPHLRMLFNPMMLAHSSIVGAVLDKVVGPNMVAVLRP